MFALVIPEAGKVQLRQALLGGGFVGEVRDTLLRRDRTHLGTIGERPVQHSWTIIDRQREKFHAIGGFGLLVEGKIEQLGQDIGRSPRRRLRVDQTLLLVLQFHVGAQSVDLQADAGLLQLLGLPEKPLGQRHAGFGRFIPRLRTKDQQILAHHGKRHRLASDALLGSRSPRPLLADLVTADLRQVEDGLRKCRSGFDILVRAGGQTFGSFYTLKVVLVERIVGHEPGLGQQRRTGDLAVALALQGDQVGREPLRVLLQRKLDRGSQRQAQRCCRRGGGKLRKGLRRTIQRKEDQPNQYASTTLRSP